MIESVSHGEIVLGGKTYYSDMIVWWDKKFHMIEKTHLLGLQLLEGLLKRNPEAIVIGTGLKGSVKLVPGFSEEAKKKTKLFVDNTGNAVDIFNGLIAQKKKAVAVLHVTL